MVRRASIRFAVSLLAVASLPVLPARLLAVTYWVDDTGAGAACTNVNPCPAIATAVGLTVAGDIVRVLAGTYPEFAIVVPHELAIIGDGPGTIVDGGGNGPIFTVDAPGDQVLLSRLTLTNGDAGFSSGGAIELLDGDLTISGSQLVANEALSGGAISHQSPGRLLILTSLLEGNLSSATGGAIACDGCGGIDVRLSILRGNTAGTTGGAIDIEVSTLDIWMSAISENSAEYGAGVHALLGPTTILDSALRANAADVNGGAIFSTGEVTIMRSTLAVNTAVDNGGAAWVEGPVSLKVSSSTFSENSALCGGAFSLISVFGFGPNALLGASTFYGNLSTNVFCGGHFQSAASSLELFNSIVDGGFGNNCNVAMSGGSNNLIDDASCDTGVAAFNLGAVTLLDPVLAYNGGPTRTHLIDPLSNAVEAGRNAACLNPVSGLPLTIDQRGLTKPVDFDGASGATCDIGAVELQ